MLYSLFLHTLEVYVDRDLNSDSKEFKIFNTVDKQPLIVERKKCLHVPAIS